MEYPPKYASALELMPANTSVCVPNLSGLKRELVPQTVCPPATVTGDAIMILTVV